MIIEKRRSKFYEKMLKVIFIFCVIIIIIILVELFISRNKNEEINDNHIANDYLNEITPQNEDNVQNQENVFVEEDRAYTNDELSAMSLDYFMNNTDGTLSKDEYSVGVSEEVPDIYKDKNMVVIEIRHINNGNNTLDARYYINIYTASGSDDLDNPINLIKKESMVQ